MQWVNISVRTVSPCAQQQFNIYQVLHEMIGSQLGKTLRHHHLSL